MEKRILDNQINEEVNTVSSDLLYRNHFVLGPEFPVGYENWQRIRVCDAVALTVHPTLNVTQFAFNDGSLTSLGFLLDPYNPEATDSDILQSLADEAHSFEDILQRSEPLGGRWVLIYENGAGTFLFNDAAGLRQVFYTYDQSSGSTWCATQPMMIADLLGIQEDREAVDFINYLESYNLSNPPSRKGMWWPGVGSQYKEIKHLTPNYYLDLSSGSTQRFYPFEDLEMLSVDTAVEILAPMLQGTLLSTANRFDELTVLITAGLDSRLVFSACRPFADRLDFVTLDYAEGATEDITVPRDFLAGLDLQHEVAPVKHSPSDDFRELYAQHSIVLNEHYAANAEALLPFFHGTSVSLTGNNAGIFINNYRLPRVTAAVKELTPELLTRLVPEMGNHPFAIKAFGEWLDELGNVRNYKVLDLLYWEQRAANWLANWLTAYDLVWKDAAVPLNSREMLKILLSVDEKYRVKPRAVVHREIINNLWPEVPLNLASDDYSTQRRLKKAFRKNWGSVRKNVEFTIR